MLNLSDKVLHYFYQPKYAGELAVSDANVLMAEIITADGYIHLQLFIELENDIIKNCKFKALGCPVAIACLAFIAEYLHGKNFLECKEVTAEWLIKQLELPREKYSLAILTENLLKKMISRA